MVALTEFHPLIQSWKGTRRQCPTDNLLQCSLQAHKTLPPIDKYTPHVAKLMRRRIMRYVRQDSPSSSKGVDQSKARKMSSSLAIWS